MVETWKGDQRESAASLLALVHHLFHARAFEACLVLKCKTLPKEEALTHHNAGAHSLAVILPGNQQTASSPGCKRELDRGTGLELPELVASFTLSKLASSPKKGQNVHLQDPPTHPDGSCGSSTTTLMLALKVRTVGPGQSAGWGSGDFFATGLTGSGS